MPPSPKSRRALIPAILLCAVAPACLSTLPAARAAASDPVAAADDGPGAGTLLLRGPGLATTLPAVRLGTDMDVTVTGSVARVRVTQAFRNGSDKWMEATYLYPLPEDGAVDGLRMVVGQRIVIGHIERRAAARAVYEQAKAKGRKAGLVEQLRPNMFTTSVANIAPGETVLVAIDYQMPVAQLNGTFSLRLPLVVGPRYVPPHSLNAPAAIADARTVTAAPLLDPRRGQALNPTSITVHLHPGFPVANLISRYHQVAIGGTGDDRTIRLRGGEVPADRDFAIDWRSAAATPTIGLFHEKAADGDYVMATITPPAIPAAAAAPPREMVFVIDNSGSMGGESIEEAKASLVHALATLRPQDRFNIIRFDDSMTQLFPRSVAATPDQVAFATRFATGLQAGGGTEMLPALKAALADAAAGGDARTLRQIVFLTDGEISNEQEMLATLARGKGRSHVFLVGIGSAPNDYLMARMATIGRGTYTHVGSPEEVAAKMVPLLDALRRPAMRDVQVTVAGGTVDWTPKILPDLYAGAPLLLIGRTDRRVGKVTVSGTVDGRPWMQQVDLADARPSPAIARLWARRRIDDIEADRTLGTIAGDAADEAIATIGLKSGLVTSQTSLVAVDETPARPAGATLTREDLPLNLPAGWDFDALFGGRAGDVAGTAAQAMEPAAPLDLPRTATNFLGVMAQGLALSIAAVAGLVLRQRRGRTA